MHVMPEPMDQLLTDFRQAYEELRHKEKIAADLTPGRDAHRAIMLEVFAAEDRLFDLATVMLCLKEA